MTYDKLFKRAGEVLRLLPTVQAIREYLGITDGGNGSSGGCISIDCGFFTSPNTYVHIDCGSFLGSCNSNSSSSYSSSS